MAALALFIWAAVAYGWFEAKKEKPGTMTFGNSEALGVVSFRAGDNGEAAHTLSRTDPYYNAVKQSFTVELFDGSKPNYFGRMRLDITYVGTGASCLRVIIVEEWKDASGRIMRMPATAYGINSSKWIDNRKADLAFYYSDISDPDEGWFVNNETAAGTTFLPLITGDPQYSEPLAGTVLTISIIIETVQFNRYKEIWGLAAYPAR